MIIHPLTPSSSPRRIWGSRLQAIWWRCCWFLWQSEETGCLYVDVKCDYFTETPGCRLFKAHSIQNYLVPPAHQTPSVLYSFHLQHSQSGVQRLSSNKFFQLEREMRYICAYELSLITFLMSKFYLILARIRCLSLLLKLLIFIPLHFLYCRVCSALRWKQCVRTSQKQLWRIWCLWICYVMEKATIDFTGSTGGRGSVLSCQIILPFIFPNVNSHKPRLLWYTVNTGKINFQLVTWHFTEAGNEFL